MPIDYSIDSERGLILTRVTGRLNLELTEDYFARLQQDDGCPEGAIEIVDFSEVTDFELKYGEMSRITSTYQSAKARHVICATIFHCTSDLAFGVARMLQTLHEFANVKHTAIITRSREQLDRCIDGLRSAKADPGPKE